MTREPTATPSRNRRDGRRTVTQAAGLLTACTLLAACTGGDAGADKSTSTTTSIATKTATDTATGKASSTSTAAAGDKVAAQYDKKYGTFKVVSETGSGDDVVAVPSGAKAGLVTLTHQGASNFAVEVLDKSNKSTGDLLVDMIGSYSGTTGFGLMELGMGEPAKIKISADGPWTLKLAPISSAPVLKDAAEGKGDAVFRFDGEARDWKVENSGVGTFVLMQTGGSFPDMAINEIGDYSGTVPLGDGPSMVTVMSDGSWSLT